MIIGTCGDCRTGRVDETGVVVFCAVGARDAASAAQVFGFSVGEIKQKSFFFSNFIHKASIHQRNEEGRFASPVKDNNKQQRQQQSH